MNKITKVLLAMSIPLIALPVWAQSNDVDTTDGINRSEAQHIARSIYPDSTTILTELDYENGMQAWDVKLDNGMSVYVAIQTGVILEIEPWQGDWNQTTMSVFVPPIIGNADRVDIGQDGVSFQEAQAIARSYYPDANMIEADLESENGVPAWDILLDNGMAIYIHAETGAVIEFEQWTTYQYNWENDLHDAPPWAGFPGGRRGWNMQQQQESVASPSNSTSITLMQAKEIALTQYPNASVLEGELVREEDYSQYPVWDIELSNGMGIYIDAVSGQILQIEPED